jgi:hypothetical protein
MRKQPGAKDERDKMTQLQNKQVWYIKRTETKTKRTGQGRKAQRGDKLDRQDRIMQTQVNRDGNVETMQMRT